MWDIIGVGEFEVVLVQVKSNKWVYGKELKTLVDMLAPVWVTKQMHRWDNRAKEPLVRVVGPSSIRKTSKR